MTDERIHNIFLSFDDACMAQRMHFNAIPVRPHHWRNAPP